jgi:hypothetical protein
MDALNWMRRVFGLDGKLISPTLDKCGSCGHEDYKLARVLLFARGFNLRLSLEGQASLDENTATTEFVALGIATSLT